MRYLKPFTLFESIGKLTLDPSEYNIVNLETKSVPGSGGQPGGLPMPKPKNIESIPSGPKGGEYGDGESQKPSPGDTMGDTQGGKNGDGESQKPSPGDTRGDTQGDKKGDGQQGQENLIGKKIKITEGPEKGRIGIIKQILPNGDIIIE